MAEPFLAEIKIFAGDFAPRSWAFCDGQLLPIPQNTALFSLIGTTYGGDGRITTALPNLQGRVPMHPGRGPGLTTRMLGQRTGIGAVALYEAQIPAHTHMLRASSSLGTTGEPQPEASLATSSGGPPFYYKNKNATPLTLSVNMESAAIGTTGGGQPHDNMQPFLTLNYIIALQGVFPARS